MVELLTLIHGGILVTLIIFIVFHRWNFIRERGKHVLIIIVSYFLMSLILMVRVFRPNNDLELWTTLISYVLGIIGFFLFMKYNDETTKGRIFHLEVKLQQLENDYTNLINRFLNSNNSGGNNPSNETRPPDHSP